MNLNLRINDCPIFLSKEVNEAELKNYNLKKAGIINRLMIKPNKDEIVWWSKNCTLKYLNDDFENSIEPILNIKAGTDMMFGTSAYLWFKEHKLIRLTFQIIKNRMVAEIALKKLEEKLIEVIGKPNSSELPIIIWEGGNQKFMIEYPHQMQGYVHLTPIFAEL